MVTGVGVIAPAQRAEDRGREAAAAVGRSRAARAAARLGYVGRGTFYLLLAYLTVQVAMHDGVGRQANAHGALSLVAGSTFGVLAIAATAAGFLSLGVVRVAAAARDRSATTGRRVLTTLYGLFYVALTMVPLSFVLGRHRTGSEQQQHAETGRVLSWPGGRAVVIAVGLIVIGASCWQIWAGLHDDFMAGMDVTGRMRSVTSWAGTVGIVARALVFVPVGVFLVVAAAQYDPRHADGLDRELSTLATDSWWGPAVLGLVAAGLVVFAGYTFLEARYRRLRSGK